MSAAFWNGILADHAEANVAAAAYEPAPEHRLLYENSYARAYLEGSIRTALIYLETLEGGRANMAKDTLRRALAHAGKANL